MFHLLYCHYQAGTLRKDASIKPISYKSFIQTYNTQKRMPVVIYKQLANIAKKTTTKILRKRGGPKTDEYVEKCVRFFETSSLPRMKSYLVRGVTGSLELDLAMDLILPPMSYLRVQNSNHACHLLLCIIHLLPVEHPAGSPAHTHARRLLVEQHHVRLRRRWRRQGPHHHRLSARQLRSPRLRPRLLRGKRGPGSDGDLGAANLIGCK